MTGRGRRNKTGTGCNPVSGWRPHAASFRQPLPAEVKLIESSAGVFGVEVDGVLVYSKKQTSVFPDEARLVEQLPGG